MAVGTEICATAYLGNGSDAIPYPVMWPFLDPGHIKVRVRNPATDPPGEWRTLAEWEYQVSLWENEGSEMQYNPRVFTADAYSEPWQVVIFRETPVLQPTIYPEAGEFPAKSHETGLDRTIMIVQELRRDLLGGGMDITFGNVWWTQAQGSPYVLGKPFELVSIGGFGAADQGKAAIFDSEGGLRLAAAVLMNVRRIGFHADVFLGVGETRALTADDNGKVLYYTGAPAITLTAGSNLPEAFSCKIKQHGTGAITIAVADLTLRHPDGHNKTRTQWSQIYIERHGSNLELSGDTAA